MRKELSERAEKKVDRVLTDGNGGPMLAVLYREVDDINTTLCYELNVVVSGKKTRGPAESLLAAFHKELAEGGGV